VRISDPDWAALTLRVRTELLAAVTAHTGIPMERRVSMRDPLGVPLAVTLSWQELVALLEFGWEGD
jgi:hypothetical protein